MAAWILAAIALYTGPVQALEVSARSAVLLDGGDVLWEKNADEKSLIASTTKIMTALVVLEQADLEDVVQVDPAAVGVEGSSMYLKAGEELTVRDLLHGLMLSSGNDAAVALAIHVAGSVDGFAALMNDKAAQLGLETTHFANPNGLDDEGNYATARSLGLLASAAMEREDFRQIVSARTYTCAGHAMTNHNKLLWQYPGAEGVKTGFTKHAGRILVGSAQRNGRRLVSVTINAPDDWNDHRAMLDYGFSLYSPKTLVTEGTVLGAVPVVSGLETEVPVAAAQSLDYALREDETVETRLYLTPFVYAPVEMGTALGTMELYLGGRCIGQMELLAAADVAQLPEEPGAWERFLQRFSHKEDDNAGTCAKDTCP